MKMTRKVWLKTSIATLMLAVTGSVLAQSNELRVGLIPSEDAQAMMRASQQVMEQLEQKTGLKVKPFVANDYNGVIEAMRSNKIDVAYFGPFSYVLAAQMANAEAFAIPVSEKSGQSSYQSIIISKKDNGLTNLAQLQGKTFAFVDPSSASGHLFPKAGLKGDGIDTDEYFSRVIFSGSHDASIMAVVHGKVDAAAVASPIFQTAIAKGHVKAEDFQVIWTSQAIPESPMAWRQSLDAETKQKVAVALAEIKGLPWGDRGVLNGFAATNDAAYNVVRDTAKALDLDLGSMK